MSQGISPIDEIKNTNLSVGVFYTKEDYKPSSVPAHTLSLISFKNLTPHLYRINLFNKGWVIEKEIKGFWDKVCAGDDHLSKRPDSWTSLEQRLMM